MSQESQAKHACVCPEDETEGQRSRICHSRDPDAGFMFC